MTEILTSLLQRQIKEVMQSMVWIQPEVTDLSKLYWSGGVSSEIALLLGSDAATKASKHTKNELISGLTLAEQLVKFFNNQAVTQGDYHSSLESLIYGNDERVTPISVATESFGTRIKTLADASLVNFNKCKDILDLYFDSEISAAVAGLSNQTTVFGCEVSKSDLVSGVTLCEQLKKFINNEVVSTADYGSTISKWRRI